MVVAGTKDAVLMVESGSRRADRRRNARCGLVCTQSFPTRYCRYQRVGKQELNVQPDWQAPARNQVLFSAVRASSRQWHQRRYTISDKMERYGKLDQWRRKP